MGTKWLRMEVGFFDEEQNSAGDLTEFLSEKVTLIQSATGEKLSLLARIVLSSLVSFVLMFAIGFWELSIAMFVSLPIMAGMAAVQMVTMMSLDDQSGKETDE